MVVTISSPTSAITSSLKVSFPVVGDTVLPSEVASILTPKLETKSTEVTFWQGPMILKHTSKISALSFNAAGFPELLCQAKINAFDLFVSSGNPKLPRERPGMVELIFKSTNSSKVSCHCITN